MKSSSFIKTHREEIVPQESEIKTLELKITESKKKVHPVKQDTKNKCELRCSLC